MQSGALRIVYQPIVSLTEAEVHAHEALVRGPHGSSFQSPEALLQGAAMEGCLFEFEVACVRLALKGWHSLGQTGRIFVNLSASALMHLMRSRDPQTLKEFLQACKVLPRNLILEITEHERVQDMDGFATVVQQVHSTGVGIALDDFGDGRSSLRLWSQIKPEVVKIDKYFTRDISVHADKLKTIQAIQQLAETFDSLLVAEGIETGDDLRVLRDLGVQLGQGYFLGRPQAEPLREVNEGTREVLQDNRLAVLPVRGSANARGTLRRISIVDAPVLALSTTNDEVAKLFAQSPHVHALAVVSEGRPVGLINRVSFMNEYAKLYYREVAGRKPCTTHINFQPRIVERSHRIDELVGILTSDDQRYLNDGFIVTENGRYVGLGTGEQLVRSVTESRIEAARHANPLTFLPGNVPTSQHLQRLLRRGGGFVACYADLNQFKPFNDYYGYWRGDEMIRLMARVAQEHCDRRKDFLGHIGGDDFVLLFQSPDWHERCSRIVERFNAAARELFEPQARQQGGIHAEDRFGVRRFFPCTTVSMGVIRVESGKYQRAEDVANAAAVAKNRAKTENLGIWVQPKDPLPAELGQGNHWPFGRQTLAA
ncbi:EAL domain-containing protein [Curvibacter sp. APW13]|uniref:EAL domain-containing protein n=1 Tax=Curvibacter sp. APW13 TaxID=3077236 RepID=UPI003965667C